MKTSLIQTLLTFVAILAMVHVSTIIRMQKSSDYVQLTSMETFFMNEVEERVTVIDTTFYDGEPILLFRIAALFDKVDRFYIVESKYTMDGQLKTSLHKDVNGKLFEPYMDKIQWIVQGDDLGAVPLDDMKRTLRRAFVPKVRADLEEGIIAEPFVFISSEVDEIINPNDIDEFQPGRKLHELVTRSPIVLNMESFEYNLNWKREEKISNAVVLPGRFLDRSPGTFHGKRGQGSKLAHAVAPKIDSGYRLANFFDLRALSNKVRYPTSTVANFSDDLREDACAAKCASGEEECQWKRCNLKIKAWDYKQAAASLQRFHELICELQNVDPATGILSNDSTSRNEFSSFVGDMKDIGDSKDWESIAEVPYAGDKVTVVDSVQYNGEPILLARLATLYDTVDRFYISEGTHTHAGDKKDKLFKDINAHLFEPYKDKIHWVVFDMSDLEEIKDHWWRENQSRQSTIPKIREDFDKGAIAHPFVVLSMDVDEIPEPRHIAAFQPGQKYHEVAISSLITFSMNFFYFNLNWKLKREWSHPLSVPGHMVLSSTMSNVSFLRNEDLARFVGATLEGGYHMSFFLTLEEIKRKIESFVHQEFNKDEFKTDEHIKQCLLTGQDLFKREGYILEHWDYRQAPLPLQKLHKEVCQSQNVDPL